MFESREVSNVRTGTGPGDILELIAADHAVIKQVFADLNQAPSTERAMCFLGLVHTLVAHEVAEELVVYPAIRADAPEGEAQARERTREQAAAEEILVRMGRVHAASPEFSAWLSQLSEAVLVHARAEEHEVFPMLAAITSEEGRLELGVQYGQAKERAPSRAHPHLPHTLPANRVLGPVAALIDAARDITRTTLTGSVAGERADG